ncbi:hypothetical protein ACKUVQ_19955 [Mycobacterium seoulense]
MEKVSFFDIAGIEAQLTGGIGGADPMPAGRTGGRVYDIKEDSNSCKHA